VTVKQPKKKPQNNSPSVSPPHNSPSLGGQSNNSSQEAVTSLAATTEMAVQSSAAAQQQQVTEGIQTRAVIEKSNKEVSEKLGSIEKLLKRQDTTFKRTVLALGQQMNP